jgi:hypothetical protein
MIVGTGIDIMKQYFGNYQLGCYKNSGNYLPDRFTIIGETDEDTYYVFNHYTETFGEVLKSHTTQIEINDVNFKRGWCIPIKNVYHHINTKQNAR